MNEMQHPFASTPLSVTLSRPEGDADKPLLVLGHSLGTGPLIWRDVVPLLLNDFRVSLLTLPGHDASEVPSAPFTLAQLADAVVATATETVGEQKIFYAGVSIGGALGLELALRHPDRMHGIGVVAAGAALGTPEHWLQRATMIRSESPAALAESSSQLWFAEAAHRDRAGAVEQVLQKLKATSSEGYARCAEALATFDVRDQLSEIEVPLLALWGEHDSIATEAMQDELVASAPRAHKVMIADCAHQPPVEQPEQTAAALLDFFGTLANRQITSGDKLPRTCSPPM